jgi:hypothetical protein
MVYIVDIWLGIRYYLGVVNTDEGNDMTQVNGFGFEGEDEDQFLNEFTTRRVGEGDGTGVSDHCGASISSEMVSMESVLDEIREDADWYREQVALLEDWVVGVDE